MLKKQISATTNILAALFNSAGSLYFKQSTNYTICTSTNTPIVSVKTFKDENYFPVAFFKNSTPVGGGVFSFSLFTHYKKTIGISAQSPAPKIKCFISGCCLFGDDLLGIDADGLAHPLTDPKYALGKNKVLQKIILKGDIHPYESIIQKMLFNLIPLIKAFSENEQGKIIFHLPAPEYILYAIKLYLNKQMSDAALLQYLKFVTLKKQMLMDFLHYFQGTTNIEIVIASPLDVLNIDNHISQLIAAPEKPTEKDFTKSIMMSLIHDDSVGIWALAFNGNEECDLLDINYLSYTVHAALSVSACKPGFVCLLDMFDEKKIGREYAKIFSQKFGPLLGIHWIPPVLLNDGTNNSLYFCGSARESLASYISSGLAVPQICGLLQKHEPSLIEVVGSSQPGVAQLVANAGLWKKAGPLAATTVSASVDPAVGTLTDCSMTA